MVQWLANPENLQAESLPPFIENFDATPYLASALPIAGGVLGISLLSEIVQRSVAATKQVCRACPSSSASQALLGVTGSCAHTPVIETRKQACLVLHGQHHVPLQGVLHKRSSNFLKLQLTRYFMALVMQIKLGPPLFVPNGQVGTFGALSQIKSLVRNRTDLFDLGFSRPAAAAAVSAAVFLVGLVLSNSGLPKVRSNLMLRIVVHDDSTRSHLC